MADQAKPETEEDDKEEAGYRTPPDLLTLQRTIRALEKLGENEQAAIVGYLSAKYRK